MSTTIPSSTGAASRADPSGPAFEGQADVLLGDRSLVRGLLLPLQAGDPFVQIAMDQEAGTRHPLRIRRDSVRAIKLAGWPDCAAALPQPQSFRFEFDDAEVLAGQCVRVSTDADGAWLQVLERDGTRQRWFVAWRRCVSALLDGRPVVDRPTGRECWTPPRPASLDALWALLSAHAPFAEGATTLPEALVGAGWIDRDALESATVLRAREASPAPLEQSLVDGGTLSEARLRIARAAWMGACVVDPGALVPDPAALALLTRAQAERYQAVPMLLRGDALVMLVADPWDKTLLDELRFVTQRRILPVMATADALAPEIRRAYDQAGAAPGADAPTDVHRLALALMAASDDGDDRNVDVVTDADSALVRLLNSAIGEAIARRASDIHIETAEPPRDVRVRLRIDGEMLPFVELPARLRFAVVARIKVMAGLDISEHRRPQDGKIDFARFGGAQVELRVVTVPTSHGLEDVVLRLLSGLAPRPLDGIDLSPDNLARLRAAAFQPYGLILICGPTGCGKTTTLHSVLRDLNTDARKIWTAEDPIEITQHGLRQVQVNPQIGWTFASAMRTFLRADPDVIMIGEMRDEETARIAIEASLTGHLVLSTLHTNSAAESIARLLEIGLDPFNFADSLLAILAQRLVRRLCQACSEAVVADDPELDRMAALFLGPSADAAARAALRQDWQARHGDEQGRIRLLRRRGCAECEGHGYHGRLAIHELMLADDASRVQIRHRESAATLQATALAAGMRTLRQDGIDKVLAGLTDLSEVLAATSA